MKKILLTLLLTSSVAFAAVPCQNAKDIPSFSVCAYKYEETATKTLNHTYKKALAAMEKEMPEYETGKTASDYLIESQKLWVQQTEHECKNPAWNFGSSASGAISLCRASKATTREQELRKLYLR